MRIRCSNLFDRLLFRWLSCSYCWLLQERPAAEQLFDCFSLIAHIQADYMHIIVADDARKSKNMIYALPFCLPIK